MAARQDDLDRDLAVGTAQLLVNLIGANSADIDICRNVVDGRGIDPAAVRDAVRRSAGTPMTPPPDLLSAREIVEWGDDGGVIRAPIWTEAGRSNLQIMITVRAQHAESSAMGFWTSYVSGIVDERGVAVLTPEDAPAPTPPEYPDWTEPRVGRRPDDPRIPRGAFTGASYGVRFGRLLDGVHRVHPIALDALDELNDGQSAIVLLHSFFSDLYGDGISAAYQRLAVDGAPRRLTAAAELVGAAAHAQVFAAVEQALPSEVRSSAPALRSHLEDCETAAWDAGQEDSTLLAYEDQLHQLEDDGDLVWQHMARYVEQQPDQFFTPE